MLSSGRSPAPALIFGLIITLGVVVAYSWYVTRQIDGLRALQNNLADRSRKDSLQLLRIQGDLNQLALSMRDMLDNEEPYPLTAWSAEFQRIHRDLDDALRTEAGVAIARSTPAQREYLARSFAQFWNAADRMLALAQSGKDAEARSEIRITLQARQASLSTAVARLLLENNAGEQRAAEQASAIYDRVQHRAYLFLIASLLAIVLTSVYLIYSNRRLFARLAALSSQRSELAQKLISAQELALRHISRELHDEFGQILTAVGSMLGRAERHAADPDTVRAELREVRDIAQNTLENVRSLSQSLHPVMLEEAGLEATLDWYIANLAKQTGMAIHYSKSGAPLAVNGTGAIHIYRIVQEALNNAVRHSGATEAWVRLHSLDERIEMEVEDHGKGIEEQPPRSGIGMVAMRERAELLGGAIEFVRPQGGGTLVRLRVPRGGESHGGA
ncbi:MAG TPA: ATP-binding protein [Candidatus Acidoferrales bacterium]|nr:ATP-binding protein [Candidatus Acidoferrales bacterium]